MVALFKWSLAQVSLYNVYIIAFMSSDVRVSYIFTPQCILHVQVCSVHTLFLLFDYSGLLPPGGSPQENAGESRLA